MPTEWAHSGTAANHASQGHTERCCVRRAPLRKAAPPVPADIKGEEESENRPSSNTAHNHSNRTQRDQVLLALCFLHRNMDYIIPPDSTRLCPIESTTTAKQTQTACERHGNSLQRPRRDKKTFRSPRKLPTMCCVKTPTGPNAHPSCFSSAES
ncbi:hypothetical protein CRENBAI_007882 [Crenichthys baileyi]|uniref:Uncharacterized protein n=1 Tax=Crenichthys baileyi TaxID=28760 RepID=A0AAV9RUR1_9TELE